MLYLFFRRLIRRIFCEHKYKREATGSYNLNHDERIEVFYLKCKKCNCTKQIITYINKVK